mmetsp:Transcript_57043/g.144640  ORF Transcript_57043/g.144640 Transcript_57043/m.144640 type:complete len:239 (-) Transcript_57043:510-1226(-)
MRCTLWMACSSTAGFHHKSRRYRRDAAMRFRPTPPAFRETIKVRPGPAPLSSGAGSDNQFTLAWRWSRLKEPSKRCQFTLAASNALPTKSKKEVHCENTTTRRPSAMSRRSRDINAFIFVLSAPSPPAAPWPTPAGPRASAMSRAGKREAPGKTLSDLRSIPGLRQTGHSPPHLLGILSAHSRQKIWPQGVMVGSCGTSQQMGQSERTPLRISSSTLVTNFSDVPVAVMLRRQRCSMV